MKVLISGSCGFILSNFVIYSLQETDWDIVSIDKLTYAGSLLNISHNADIQNKRHKFYLGDVCDSHFVKKVFDIEKPDIVLHGCAESHVDNSIKDSSCFVTTNVLGTHSMLEAARQVHTPKKFINVSCYDKETRVPTKCGLKTFDKIKEGDIVFTLNPVTRTVEEQPVEKVIIQDYSGNMVHFIKSGVDCLITPNHRVYDDNMNVLRADECINHKIIRFPKPKGFNGKLDPITIGGKNVDLKDLFYIIGVYIGDGFTAYQEKITPSKSGLNKDDYVNKSRDSKSGRFTSTGKIGSNDYVTSKSWRIFFDIPENDKARKRTEATLSSLGIKFTGQSGKSGEHLYFSSEVWLKYFEQFGKYAKNKHIPQWMLEYDAEILQCLFDGLIDSDGCRSKNLNISFSTVSEKLKDNICELAIKLNMFPNVNYNYNENYLDGRKISGYGWSITFSGGRNKLIKQNDIKDVFYSDKVWCVKVKNKNLLVERNGKYIFSGNTDEVYGSVEHGSSLESDPMAPRSPYSSTKASADLLGQSYFITHGLPVITTRCSNNFGPRQHVEKFIPKIITNVLNNREIPLYGSGKNMREWLYVKDHFYALKKIIESGVPGEAYNISSGNEMQNIDILHMILDFMDAPRSLIRHVNDRLGHDMRYSVNTDKIRALGWESKYTLSGALSHTIGWYKSNPWFWKDKI